ncbi:MAG: type II toxin-antitoxin system HicB family antitoxin [Enhydrobacter sp.]|nr:MAG: type II toxin-antitoxin system HicB family antitoxin [Enhydrobacter sp.]
MSAYYVAILEQNSGGEFFAHVPDLPGVNAAGATRAEALSFAIEFANDYVRDLVEDGHPVPEAREFDQIETDPEVEEVGRALIPVEVPGKSIKISLSIDEALLKRVDRAANEQGLTRSAYFASALNTRLRPFSTEPMAAEMGPVGTRGSSPRLHGFGEAAAARYSSRPTADATLSRCIADSLANAGVHIHIGERPASSERWHETPGKPKGRGRRS